MLGKDGRPLAVIEAKKTNKDAQLGREQAKQYCINIQKQTQGELPFCFYSNGLDIFFWDIDTYPPRKILGFPTRDDLERFQYIRRNRKPLTQELINIYTLSAVTGNCFQEIYKPDTFSQIHKKYFPTTSDFLLCRGNGNLNLVGKGYSFPGISEGVIFPDTIIAVSIWSNTINRYFFEALWKTRFIRQQIESNARTTNGAHKINQGVIEKIKIIQPPVDLQNQFGSIVEKVESLKSQYQQSLTDLEALYGALSQQAFRGELDLSRVHLTMEFDR